jgi:hypothetical protein
MAFSLAILATTCRYLHQGASLENTCPAGAGGGAPVCQPLASMVSPAHLTTQSFRRFWSKSWNIAKQQAWIGDCKDLTWPFPCSRLRTVSSPKWREQDQQAKGGTTWPTNTTPRRYNPQSTVTQLFARLKLRQYMLYSRAASNHTTTAVGA